MGRYELTLRGSFSAAHRLRLYDGSQEPMHGHNWRVEVCLEGGELDAIGILADFTRLQTALGEIMGELHNTCLNDHPALGADNPTTERVARWVCERMSISLAGAVRVGRVRVWETAECAAAYIPEPRTARGAGEDDENAPG